MSQVEPGRRPEIARTNDWSLSDERGFMENLVQQRFNFLLVVYSLVVAGALSTTSEIKFKLALTVGATLCTLIFLTIYRIHIKLDHILIILHDTPEHPVSVISEKVKAIGIRGLFNVGWIIGILIPVLCSLSLVISAMLAWLGHLKA